jgi:hypothetical protein
MTIGQRRCRNRRYRRNCREILALVRTQESSIGPIHRTTA